MLRSERKIMDRDFGLHYHRINNSNYIEYRAPSPSKVKYTPPSPTTSGYSESSCEMDNHDSGQVSEMENSPKIQHQRRPNNISLSMGIFNPGEGQMTSPDPFPEGKSTIKMNENIEQRRLESSGVDLNANDSVLVNVKTLRTLVLSLRQAQSRLDSVETKIDHIVKAIQLQHNSSQKISKTVLALGNDLKQRDGLENGRLQPKMLHPPSASLPLSCNNNNVSRAPCTGNSKKYQSSECIRSSEQTSLPPKSSPHSEYKTATFPRFLRTDAAFHLPLSVAAPPDKEPEKYDNVDTEDKPTPIASHYVNSDVACASVTEHKSPLYAVVKKKNKSTEYLNSESDNPPVLPRRSCDMMVPLDSDDVIRRGNSEENLNELIKEMTESEINSSVSEELPYDSLTRTSRFSDVEDLMAVFDNSPVFSENKLPGNENPETWQEEYDNKNSNANLNSEVKNEPTYRDGNRSAGSVLCSSLTDINERERFLEPVSKIGQSWHDLDEATFSIVPNTAETTFSQQNGGVIHSDLSQSDQQHATGRSKSHTSIVSENSKKNAAGSKKGNVLSNVFSRRKNKKQNRSISQNSFTFVNSPLYESEITQRIAEPNSPNNYNRGPSVDSVGNERENSIDVTVVSSLSTLSSSHDDNVFLGHKRFSSESITSDHKKRSGEFISSPANSQLLRLQSGEAVFNEEDASSEFDNSSQHDLEEHYDNTSIDQEDKMRPNLIKLAKQAIRNSPKLRKKAKTPNGNVHTAEIKKLVPNGHVAKISTPTVPPKVPEKQKPKTESTNVEQVTGDDVEDDIFIPPGVILDKQQREQADRLRFEIDHHASSNDKPPPKPNRPGFSHGGGQGSPRSSVNAHGASNGSVPGYPRGMPAVPPKAKIMTPEELTNHEAQEKLRLKQMEEEMLQQTLDQQQKQARENAMWLEQEEHMLYKSLQNPENAAANGEEGSSNSLADLPRTAPPPPNVAPSKPPRKGSRPKEEPTGPPQTKLEEVKTAPTMQLNRDNDHVYKDTMEVVKAVLSMNNMTMNAKPDELFASVKTVGAALKQLCTSLEKTLPSLPEDFHREIDMAQKTTNKDLSQVINQLKLVQRFFTTTQVVDYKKCLMAANQVLAIDAKNLLDVVDRARIRKIQTAQESQSRKETEDSYPDGDFL